MAKLKVNEVEANSTNENQLILGRDSDYAISKETQDHGSSFSIMVSAHMSRVEKLNLIPLREGKYPVTNLYSDGIANKTAE